MKQSDIFTIIIVATFGTLAAYFGLNALLGDPNMEKATFKNINQITEVVNIPDPELFNPDAINPTVEVYVGDCEDIDRNGIISTEEMIACGKLSIEDEQRIEERYCADGTAVLDLSLCPENMIHSEENNTGVE